ncbi:MAG TPA: MASE1 domain-containing protein, partial [Gemmatimonadales bacterium]|nr:MASE1 domain-containing protein [Gemmatimonadales bacterium]
MPLFATRRARDLAAGLLLLLVYVVVGKLGLRLAFAYPSATPVWPATGLALAAFLRFGRRVWPAVFLGAFIVNETTAGTIATSVLIAAGNTLEALTGAWLIERYAGGRTFFLRADGIFKFTILAALVSTAISATIGVLTLRVAGLLPADATHSAWITWWLGDASGDLLVAPVLLSWATLPRWRPTRAEALEALALFVTLPIVGIALFGSAAPFERSGAPPTFFGVPLLIWAAVRLGFRKASTATLLLATI